MLTWNATPGEPSLARAVLERIRDGEGLLDGLPKTRKSIRIAKCTDVPDPVEPLTTVFVSSVTEDLYGERDAVVRYLDQEGFEVLPTQGTVPGESTTERALRKSCLFVRLLSADEKTLTSRGQHQYLQATEMEMPVLQWRDPTLNVDGIVDKGLKNLLSADTVQASDLTTFSSEVLERANRVSAESFDVFLAYDSRDRVDALQLARALRGRGLRVWIDDRELPAGRSFQEEIHRRLVSIPAVVVCLGPDGAGPWQSMEILTAFNLYTVRGRPIVIPTFLPGAEPSDDNPPFIGNLSNVIFRKPIEQDEEALERLLASIPGLPPSHRDSASSRLDPES